jgi:aromatic-L-amino-acid/L-tryptophan decarboxylase
MSQEKFPQTEESLDPQDWEAMRALAHQMLDDMLDHQQHVRDRAPWQHAPDDVKAHFRAPLPLDPHPAEDVYQDFLHYVLPYPLGCDHPRFWGWVLGTGTFTGALADMLAAAMNTNSGGGDHHSANHVEKQVIEWIKEMLGYPSAASGLLTSGGSASNLIGLAVARNTKAPYDLRKEGVIANPRMMLYASEEIHSSVIKTVELLGLGSDALRLVPSNDRFQIDLSALREAIAQDREAGYLPFCVVGAAGTTNTGSFDDLNALADLAAEENLWLHVDGAFGAWAALDDATRQLTMGMERADSLALDLHKWMYLPFAVGCVLVRSEQAHREAFSLTPAYLAHGGSDRGMASGDLPWFSDYGFELSREFKALKVWMSLKEHGARKFGRIIHQNIDQACYLAEKIQATPQLELMAPVTISIVCFRYNRPGLSEAELDALNKHIEVEMQEQGIAVVSSSTIRGKGILRAAITNHRTCRADLDVLLQAVLRIGEEAE